MSESIVISFGSDESLADEYWVHMEQDIEKEEPVTLAEVAEVVDAVFGVNPCTVDGGEPLVEDTPVTDSDGTEESVAKAIEFLNSVVRARANLAVCDSSVDGYPPGSYATKIKIGISHQDENYKLHLSNGEILSTSRIEEFFSETYDIEEELSLELPFPKSSNSLYVNDYTYEFESVVLGPYGYQPSPEVTRIGRMLFWGENKVTGSLYVRYHCIYDLVEVVVYGDEDGNAGECNALCFYHGMVEELSLTAPLDSDATELEIDMYCSDSIINFTPDRQHNVTCYEEVTYKYMCQCHPEYLHHSYTVEEIVQCPNPDIECTSPASLLSDTYVAEDGSWNCSSYLGARTEIVDYVSCGDDENQAVHNAGYYEYKCCHAPIGDLPQCQVMRSVNRGKPLDSAVLSNLRAIWGENLVLIPVSPSDGNCGYIDTVVNVSPTNCCDFSIPITEDPSNPTNIAPYGVAVLYVLDGTGPYRWTVSGGGYSLNDLLTTEGVNVLTAQDITCGDATVRVSDACGSSLTITLTYTGPSADDFEWRSDTQELILSPGDSHRLYTRNGVSPVRFSGGGTDLTLSDATDTSVLITASEDFCGKDSSVVATDACGSTANLLVKSTDGYWKRIVLGDAICGSIDGAIIDETYTNFYRCDLHQGLIFNTYTSTGFMYKGDLRSSLQPGSKCGTSLTSPTAPTCPAGTSVGQKDVYTLAITMGDSSCDGWSAYCTINEDPHYDIASGTVANWLWSRFFEAYEWSCI